jgi:hypothetical protein
VALRASCWRPAGRKALEPVWPQPGLEPFARTPGRVLAGAEARPRKRRPELMPRERQALDGREQRPETESRRQLESPRKPRKPQSGVQLELAPPEPAPLEHG